LPEKTLIKLRQPIVFGLRTIVISTQTPKLVNLQTFSAIVIVFSREYVEMKKRNRNIVQADSPDGQRAGEALIEAVENQIRDNDPLEVRATLDRLMAMGESRENAMRYIGSVFSLEVFEILKHQTPYDEKRYVAILRNLPELPFDD
jgi:hypothetical protein